MPLTEKLDAPAEPVVPDPERPAEAVPPADDGIPAKFSDLAAFHQSLHTRLALTLAAFALTATAARPVAELLPPRGLSNGAVPFLVYAAVCTFVAGAYSALTAFTTPDALQNQTVSRLASRALTLPDETSPTLQRLFIYDITNKLKRLHSANWMLLYTFVFLMSYVVVSLFFALMEVQWPHYVAMTNKPHWGVFEAARSARSAVLAFSERHETMRLFALYLRRPGMVLLFEAMNIFATIQFIVIVVSVRYALSSRNTEAEG